MVFNASSIEHRLDSFCPLTDKQYAQFMSYYELLHTYNSVMNLTTIDTLEKVVPHHFQDSLALACAFDLNTVSAIADIGSGGGFPGIPLKIAFPHLQVFLIEVTLKKVEFLRTVIATLGLTSIEVIPLDWRTFLRTTKYPINLFCARASLQPEELVRALKPSCFYSTSSVVYWASAHWVAPQSIQNFINREVTYTIDSIPRRLIVFSNAL